MKSFHIAAIALGFLIGMLGILIDPKTTADIELRLVPLIVAGSVVSVIYMIAIYFGLQPPRSPFYRMLVGSVVAKVLLALPIGFIVLTSLKGGTLPGSPQQRQAFIVLLIGLLLTAPIAYALTIFVGRHRAARQFDGDHVD